MRSTFTIFSWLHCLLGVAYCIERPQIMELNGFIMDEDRIQKVDNDMLVLSCFAYYPVKWVLPDNSQYQNYSNPDLDGRLKTVSSNADRNNITIVISHLRWTDTGFYRCLAMDSTDTKLNALMGETENRIYLYVKDSDPKHLFLHLNGDMIPFKRFETSYLNCLVTDISATVEISFETKIDDKLKYVNGFGFEVPPKALKQISFDNAECKANVNDNISSKVDYLSFMIVAHDPPVDTFSVTISPVNVEYLFYLNNTVTMTCNANSQYKKCQWETPRGTISKDSNNELEIKDINMNDSGIYKCSCHDTMYKSPDRAGFVQKMITVREKKGQITVVKLNPISSIVYENSKKIFNAAVKILLPPDYTSSDVTVKWHRRYSILLNGYENVKEEEVKSSAIFGKFHPRLLPLNRSPRFNENPEVNIGLVIKNTTANLSGDYILSIRAMDETVNYTFHLDVVSQNAKLNIFVTEASKTDLKLNPKYLEYGTNYDVWCLAEGFPKQNGTLLFRPCIDGDNNCENMEWIRVIDNTFYKEATFQSAVVARLSATKTGMYSCSLKSNISKENVVTMPFMVSDIQNVQENQGFGVEVSVTPKFSNIFQFSKVIITCKMQKYDKYDPPKWFRKSFERDEEVDLQALNSVNYQFKTFTDEFSLKSVLTLNNIQMNQTGIYICQSFKTTNTSFARRSNATINVFATVHPSIGNESSSVEEAFTYTKPGLIRCDARGEPFPKVEWMKDNVPLNNYTRNGISFEKDGTVLKISRVVAEDRGIYMCTVSNFAGQKTSLNFKRNVDGLIPDYLVAILACVLIVLALVVLALVVAVILQRLKLKKKLKRLQEIRQKLLEPHDKETFIDDNVPLNEQTDNLAYSTDFEIPMHFFLPMKPPKNLLGTGEFGEVVKTSLRIPSSEEHAVAIKIIRSTLPVDQISELLSEVKIMIHIGDHVNVLPLIGAATACLGMNKLYVVTEYCALGSLLTVLKHGRDTFINELSTLNNRGTSEKQQLPAPKGYLKPLLSKALQHNHRSHPSETSSRRSNNLCTSDLLYFSYQIANGMEFLSSKNVIHRDLATRNILVTENNVIRISDFGLSRHGNVYQIKKNKFKLPYPWLAYESLVDYSFSMKSDVWSFGIVLWEIFTLGEQPFHEYRNFMELTNALKNNIRLPKPTYASDKIYNLMKRCWLLKPELRPDFEECKEILADEMKIVCKECYGKLDTVINDPKNQPDYNTLRSQFVQFSQSSSYETPNSRRCKETSKNHYFPFPTPTEDKK